MTPAPHKLRLQLQRQSFTLDVDLTLPGQGITVLFGASGSGKTTLLRCVAGLERAGGRVSIGRTVWQDDATRRFLPTWRRPLGYVFQESSLFSHLSVRQNLNYGLKRTRHPQGRKTLEDAIELLGIGALLDRRPESLSGGERQRVAIARALATQPELLLLDEPLASLDLPRRLEILPWLERLRDHGAVPMLYVTHSTDELSRLADYVVVMAGGRAQASGTLAQVQAAGTLPLLAGEEPASVLEGMVLAREPRWHLARVQAAGGEFLVRDMGVNEGRRIRLRVLARDASLSREEPARSSIQNHVQGTVASITDDDHPSQALVRLECGGQPLLARVTRKSLHELAIDTGTRVWVQVKTAALLG